ncbi:ankyrin repeat domain protein [Nitzschia inconspicua]|uniref:Ankyrin repeat domain protein n=1 Tax=Nitzschia inconspicua TaxID=303405 RepID=A0A9K3PPC9_9STRA|nr:ankyrin repeat domain protein [Nitzschia inconspicua]
MSSRSGGDSAALYGLKSLFSNDVTRKRTPIESPMSSISVKRRKISSNKADNERNQDSTAKPNIPDPKKHTGTPTVFLCDLFQAMHGIRLQVKKTSELEDGFFYHASQDQISAYTTDIVNAVRENDVCQLRMMYQADPRKVHCTNQFGESLLHRACRLGHQEMAAFLMQDAKVIVRITDDCGRNPLHDTCWNPNPQLEICGWLMQQDPFLFLLADKRGFTPFDYARSQHWPTWKEFFHEHRGYLDAILEDKETLSKFTNDKMPGEASI